MKAIKIQSPTRVDLAGGTLDMWPLYNFVNGAKTINVAIDIWTGAELHQLSGDNIVLESPDLKSKIEYKNLKEALEDSNPLWALNRSVLRYWQPQGGFHLKTTSQSPVGGGLGGSSSLTVSIMKAFAQWTSKSTSDSHQLVRVCHNLEAELLNTPTGTQDYYPAVSGGINILTYSPDGIRQETLSGEGTDLESHFLLIYTGKAHHSGLNNFEVLKNAVKKDPTVMKALHEIKLIADATVDAVRAKKFNLLPELFQQEYAARTLLCEEFSSPEIRQLHKISLENGASALKICGAGGGGCVLVWCAPSSQQEVVSACQRAGFQVLGAKPVNPL